jgi:prevent-host-death family protein
VDLVAGVLGYVILKESGRKQAMNRISVVELRQELADVLNRAEYRGERFVIHRRDKDAAAVIPIEDLELLERLVRQEEDRIDLAAAEAALAENDRIPLEDFVAAQGMSDEPRERAVSGRNRRRRKA